MRIPLPSLALALLAASPLAAQRPPEPYIDRGICPFECCTYRDWTAVGTIPVYAEPKIGAREMFTIAPRATFRAVTGDVHLRQVGIVVARRAVPLEVAVGEQPRSLAAGDTAYVLSYVGEGYYRLWIRGEIQSYEAFWDDRHEYPRPTDRPGVMVRDPDELWWVKVRTRAGRGGWIRMDRADVEGADACG
ncbi:MAG TPA: hypothetical protein VF092_22785 [Longimicrobium sp.]